MVTATELGMTEVSVETGMSSNVKNNLFFLSSLSICGCYEILVCRFVTG